MGKIGVAEILLLLSILIIIPVVIFYIGFTFGKKAGYLKRIKETESK